MNIDPQYGEPSRTGAALAAHFEPALAGEAFTLAETLIATRGNISPRRLFAPGPTAEQLTALLCLAAAAPDHGQLTPWQFIVIPEDKRHLLGEVFALSLIDRDPGATLDQIEAAREKAYRAPLLMVAVACLEPRQPDTPVLERVVSLGAAIQNLLLGAHALGFGAGVTSGQAMASPRLRELLALGEEQVPVCCVNIGTTGRSKPSNRLRPDPAAFCRIL